MFAVMLGPYHAYPHACHRSHFRSIAVLATARSLLPRMPSRRGRSSSRSPAHLAARMGRNPVSHQGCMLDLVASLALQHGDVKYSDVTSKIWQLQWQSNDWLSRPINLLPRKDRAIFTCSPDVYVLRHAPANALIVDFANKHVGGGCFSSGFVQADRWHAVPRPGSPFGRPSPVPELERRCYSRRRTL